MPYWYKPYYTAAISFTVWALILPSVVYMIVRALKGNEAGVFGLMWFISTYLTLTLFSLIGDRITYLFYFYPTVGAICIGIALGLSKLIDFDETRKSWIKWIAILGVSAFFILHIGAFVILSPIFAQQTTLIPSLNAP
jgi:dolichyl-phosphate-mannose--protein O-mannosyl transferase